MKSDKQETQSKSRQESSFSNRWLLASFMGILNGIILGFISHISTDRSQVIIATIFLTGVTTFIYGTKSAAVRGNRVVSFICWYFFTCFFTVLTHAKFRGVF